MRGSRDAYFRVAGGTVGAALVGSILVVAESGRSLSNQILELKRVLMRATANSRIVFIPCFC